MLNPLFKTKTPLLNTGQYGDPVCSKCRNPIEAGEIATWENGCEDHVSCPSRQDHGWDNPLMMPKKPGQPGQQPDIQQSARQSSRESAVASISSDGRRWEKVGTRKQYNGIRPSPAHAFGVSSDSANLAAMALAEAGVRDFEVATDHDINISYFSFPAPADKAMASDLLSKKLAPRIFLW
jgi:hypothetical protein